jgi:signal transduction histidine kinase
VRFLFYARLIGFAAGTLAPLFLMALLVGHRRPRAFERVLFCLVVALFLFYSGGLLIVNAVIHYPAPPAAPMIFGMGLIGVGLAFLPALVFHAHVSFEQVGRASGAPAWLEFLAWANYLPTFYFAVVVLPRLLKVPSLDLLWPGTSLGRFYGFWLGVSLLACVPLELRSTARSAVPAFRGQHRFLEGFCGAVAAVVIYLYGFGGPGNPEFSLGLATGVMLSALLPCGVIAYSILRHNFLEIGLQRNLVYAVTTTFVALLYLALVWRLSHWLEPVVPPEATASILIFVLVVLYEPLGRWIGGMVQRAMRERMDRLHRLTVELQEQARHGDVAGLVAHAERRMREEFGLATVRISMTREGEHGAGAQEPLSAPAGTGRPVGIPLRKDQKQVGMLEVAGTGAYLTGETSAALEFLAEQLPAMVDLCRLIEEKLRLERELAERERLALLGQMAASVSHNLRNPLSSMKTVLQVQLENPGLPLDVRHDCALVVDEIDRMSAKLTQLLRFAKPSVNGQRIGAVAVARQIAALFGRDAERRNVRLEFEQPAEEVHVAASEEAFSEALSNLIVNAIEAQPEGGRVRVSLERHAEHLEIFVEDDGPGISAEARAKMFQPFYTTKASGTGLGLAIVARRLAEMGGTLACESPVSNGKGARFRVTLPLSRERELRSDANDSDRG